MSAGIDPNDWCECNGYADFHRILRDRADELNIPREWIDEIAGWTPRFAGKLLSPRGRRAFGPLTLGPILHALRLRLIVVKDAEAAQRIQKQITPRKVSQIRHRAPDIEH